MRTPLFFLLSSIVIGTTAFVVAPQECRGESSPSPSSSPDICQGHTARLKRNGVPVFAEPDSTTSVIGRLELGIEVCVVGRERGFAALQGDRVFVEGPKLQLVYVRANELFEEQIRTGREVGGGTIFDRVRAFYYSIRYGVVPEQVLPFDLPVTPVQIPAAPSPTATPVKDRR